ncbi:glycosyltransferase [Actinobacteria bacterium YIM 96077]|uniref:Glycosyltransferase family 2 protein n=1 Tax=Phytoactinopolyspora halophila TaxID=1981511 RepID=A0A329QFX0_9ACTN|nr:glycosyltransferase family 2 protein [Phytoactinopolyspora halophila]AYY12676.1 glycosyltransferase [Actinobacteria bacterium YIM 96077]RAW10589.1 glycosyltransferase family 2 protein [Phytoactinopolyspora halophila]
MDVALLLLVLGVNLTFWTLVGGVRLANERWARRRRAGASRETSAPLGPDDVAVLIPAHNEEPVIAASIASALRLVPSQNVHVVADGCTDDTARIARDAGAQVVELDPGRGKAGGIEAAVRHFDIPGRFEVLLIVDADTELDEHYLERGLPMLDEPDVVALAGYAKASWRPAELDPMGRFLVAYRTRLYAVMQWLKYGQTWRWTNVTSIVPGFASMYRTHMLSRMDLNPPGLVIEDFNMTFEIHRKRLGKIAFRPGVNATTQDPDNLADYYRQVRRWFLGFWQTLRRHGFWASGFSLALLLFIVEVMVASIGLVVLALALVFLGLSAAAAALGVSGGWILDLQMSLSSSLDLWIVLFLLVLPDYLLTCLTAAAFRRPSLLWYGVGFLGLRLLDAIAALLTLPQAWSSRSTGRWVSPARRVVGLVPGTSGAAVLPGSPGAEHGSTAAPPGPDSGGPPPGETSGGPSPGETRHDDDGPSAT